MPESTTAGAQEMTITRTFDAERELVWKYFTEPYRFARWFYTPPFTTPGETVSMDVRPGGRWSATQVNEQDGTRLPFVGSYGDVDEPKRLVMIFENPGDPDDPDKEVVAITLRDVGGGKTEVTLHQQGHMPAEQYKLLEQGYSRFFDNLENVLTRREGETR
jgi:uncharacterized protein YndB with AHSA1/START domain